MYFYCSLSLTFISSVVMFSKSSNTWIKANNVTRYHCHQCLGYFQILTPLTLKINTGSKWRGVRNKRCEYNKLCIISLEPDYENTQELYTYIKELDLKTFRNIVGNEYSSLAFLRCVIPPMFCFAIDRVQTNWLM